MRMIFLRICVSLMVLGLNSSCAQAKDIGKKTTLFDGQVSFCYSEPLSEIVAQGRTGVLELDQAKSPSKAEMNTILEPFGHVYKRALKGQAWWVPSGVPKWKHICRIKLPKDAQPYILGQRTSVDPNFDNADRIDYPYLRNKPALGGYFIKKRFWFVGDRLVHVEIKATPANEKS